jgi:hypothetical protein
MALERLGRKGASAVVCARTIVVARKTPRPFKQIRPLLKELVAV